MTWRPGTPALSFDPGKHKRCPTGHRRQEASEDFFAGLKLQSGYALPPFQAGHPRLTLIDAGVSPCLPRRTPISYVDGNIHVGADVAPSNLPVRLSAGHDDVAISYGPARDGVGAEHLIAYLPHDADVGSNHNSGLIPGIEPRPATIRIAQGTTAPMRDQAIRAVQLINAALPRDWQMLVSDTPGIPGSAPPTDSDILIQFLPRKEWPAPLPPDYDAIGLAARHNTLNWVNGEY